MIRKWFIHPYAFPIMVGTGILLRLGLLLIMSFQDGSPIPDDAYTYFWLSHHWAEFDPFWPPGLPAWLSLTNIFSETSFFPGRLSMLAWYLALVWLMKKHLADNGNVLASNLAVFILSFYPALVFHSVEMLTYFPAGVLLFGIYTQLVAKNERIWLPVLSIGGMLAWLILLRPSSILLLVMVPLIWRMRGRPLKGMLFIPALAIIPILVWSSWISSQNDRAILINESGAYNLFVGNNPWTPEYRTWEQGSHWEGEAWMNEGYIQLTDSINQLTTAEKGKAYLGVVANQARSRPGWFIWQSLNRIRCYFGFDTYSGATFIQKYQWPQAIGFLTIGLNAVFWLMVLGVFGMFGIFRLSEKHPAIGYRAAILLILAFAVPYFFAFSHPTYHLPVIPIMVSFSAVFLSDGLSGKFSKEALKGNKLITGILFGIAVIFLQIEWGIRMWQSI